MQFELEPHHRDLTNEQLLDELRRVAVFLKRSTVTIDQFNEHAKFHSTTLARRFGSWFKALEAAGLEKSRNLHLTNEQLFENLVTVWLKLGRQPKYQDLTKNTSSFSAGTYEKRFATWRRALEAFVAWANEGASPEMASKSVIQSQNHRTPRNINWRLRALVLMRDGARCQLCGVEARNGATLHVDHIRPWSEGGETVCENLQILCHVCNIGKSNLFPSKT
ncbi:MAG: HNH endonuclease [Polaromonas sp.]|uniref:homing endonuclease associated repeat-containing protein n=1 Tax=Polaromonas sp. TaxID=1869339 RepID=UPI0025CBBF24|nr:HNH endonuclease [Polaromonas sp.]MBI2728606.1 HNH endonuclease [Polaromonas sp.]